MKYVQRLLSDNFLFYASYVIRDRAIPHIDDGLKPVQRRILHSLFEMDDGKFHKVSNVVGNTMKYHPHGESSIAMALVLLSNKGRFIDMQGNFGNIFTGDEASASRYIECRINTFAKDTLYCPKITDYIDSYDGRNKEPVVFPALLPFSIILGVEGIAVGMSTSIMPHNCNEVMQALRSALEGKEFALYPDFPVGGKVDVSNYDDGQGKVLVRASIDIESDKRIIIRELPYGKTTSALISSLEGAVRKGKINITEINDYTAESVEIELKLGRGERAENIIESIYALTDCEISLSLNCLLIKDEKPARMTISDVVHYHANILMKLLKRRLQVECDELQRRLHTISLERIFITKKIYSKLEDAKSTQEIANVIYTGFEPYKKLLNSPLNADDIEFLLKIPIRRISRYDIDRSQNEEARLLGELKEKKHHLRHLREYAISCLDSLIEKYSTLFPRLTKIETFSKISEREVSTRDIDIYYDEEKGQIGYRSVAGKKVLTVSEYDRLLIIRNSGVYSVIAPPARSYVGKIICCRLAEKEVLTDIVFSLIYTDSNKIAYIKRCQILQYQVGREYMLIPENTKLHAFTLDQNVEIRLQYQKKARQRKTEDVFLLADYRIRGVKASGVRLSEKNVSRVNFRRGQKTSKEG